MSVQSIQSSDIYSSRHCSVGGAALFGLLVGNAAHDMIPIDKANISKSQLHDLARYTRNGAYNKIYKALSTKDELSLGQKMFVQMVDDGKINEEYSVILKKLKNTPSELKVFKNLNWLAGKAASDEARNLLNKHIKITKLERPIFPFLIAGTVICTVGAMVYNAINNVLATRD